jgi:SAM-dependent methyltransferase
MSDQPVSPFTGESMRPRYAYGKGNLFQCRQTGFLAAHPLPSDGERAEYYAATYFDKPRYRSEDVGNWKDFPKQVFANFERRFAQIENSLHVEGQGAKKLLDIGAGTGAFAYYANTKGWQVSCVEFSTSGRESIQECIPHVEQLNPTFSVADYRSESFDAITLWAVIEHMPYDRNLFAEIRSLLKPGGVIAMSHPNPVTLNRYVFGKRWRYFIPIEHLSFYPPRLMKQLLADSGFSICRESSTFSVDAWRDGLVAYGLGWLAGGLSRRVARRLNRLFFHGDTHEIIARKT